ncbi:MAG: isochorismatase family protein [Spirochaetales bacterium]|nr:isochorismatase family protein [Spirochaetales bacterium]
MKVALLVVDMQKAYDEGLSALSMASAVEYIDEVLNTFREKSAPIIWIQDEDEDDGVVQGSEGFELIDSLKPQDGEFFVVKHHGNAFHETNLSKILSHQGVDTVFITGFCAEFCVLSTYRGAQDAGFSPYLVKNACASGRDSNLRAVEQISETVPYTLVPYLL